MGGPLAEAFKFGLVWFGRMWHRADELDIWVSQLHGVFFKAGFFVCGCCQTAISYPIYGYALLYRGIRHPLQHSVFGCMYPSAHLGASITSYIIISPTDYRGQESFQLGISSTDTSHLLRGRVSSQVDRIQSTVY